MRPTAWLLFASSLVAAPCGGQSTHQHSSAATAPQPADQLGEIDFPNSGAPAAQPDFLRGVKLLHNFQYEGAIEAFQAAEKADPDFVMAYWGEAMAHNYTLWAEQHLGAARAALAKLAPTPAARATKAKTTRERDYLAAVEVLYGDGSKFDRDIAFADRMDLLAKTYPDDIEAQVFDALATLGRSHGTRDAANYERAGAMLDPLFKRYPQHPGIAHYIIHSYDDPDHARRGLAAAQVYDKLAPDSAHAQHMTSHIYLALGMWPEVEQANINARAALEKTAGEPVPWAACGHGAIWLVYARLQQGKPVDANIAECGQAATALLAGPDPKLVVGSVEGATASHADMRVRQFVETGTMAEPLTLPEGKFNYARFVYAYGDVLAARKNAEAARKALARMEGAHRFLVSDYRKENPDDDQLMPWADLMLAQGRAVEQLATGHDAEGLAALEQVAKRESALPSLFGPPILQKPSWELLADERMAAGDTTGAAAAYRLSLKLQPGRRPSVAGVAKASQNASQAVAGVPKSAE